MAPTPFPDLGKRAKDLLVKDYNFDHKFVLSVPSSTGMVFQLLAKLKPMWCGKKFSNRCGLDIDPYLDRGLTATGLKRDQIFVGDVNTQYRSGNTTVDVKVDTYSNVTTKISVHEALPGIRTALSFNIPEQKSGKLDIQYLNHHAAINSSVGLNPSPLLDFNAAIGTKDLSLGGEVGFDTASASLTKYNAGISFNKPDFSAALVLMDKGQTLKASYYHSIYPSNGTAVAAEMTHRFSSYENSFAIGSAHAISPYTSLKTRFMDNGKMAMQCQHEWRPKSMVTLSAEYDSKAIDSSPKWGLAIALKP